MKTAITAHNRKQLVEDVEHAPDGHIVEIREPKRSDAQNRLMWELLTAISRQVKWDGETLEPEEWKDLITAVLKKQKVCRGLEGGIVVIGSRTSKMTVTEMNEVIEYAYAWGTDAGVRFPAV